MVITRSPRWRSCTSSPTVSIWPTISTPGVYGNGSAALMGQLPAPISISVWLTAAAMLRMRTSRGFRGGNDTSAHFNTLGGPYACMRIALVLIGITLPVLTRNAARLTHHHNRRRYAPHVTSVLRRFVAAAPTSPAAHVRRRSVHWTSDRNSSLGRRFSFPWAERRRNSLDVCLS